MKVYKLLQLQGNKIELRLIPDKQRYKVVGIIQTEKTVFDVAEELMTTIFKNEEILILYE